MNRRDFIGWVGVGLLGSSLPVAIAACGNQQEGAAPTATTPQFEVAGTVSQLNETGNLLYQSPNLGPILIARNPANPDLLYAVNPKCTHAGCTVEWKVSQDLFVCPCHNSQFTGSGSVSQGPATRPLATFEVKVEGDTILVAAPA